MRHAVFPSFTINFRYWHSSNYFSSCFPSKILFYRRTIILDLPVEIRRQLFDLLTLPNKDAVRVFVRSNLNLSPPKLLVKLQEFSGKLQEAIRSLPQEAINQTLKEDPILYPSIESEDRVLHRFHQIRASIAGCAYLAQIWEDKTCEEGLLKLWNEVPGGILPPHIINALAVIAPRASEQVFLSSIEGEKAYSRYMTWNGAYERSAALGLYNADNPIGRQHLIWQMLEYHPKGFENPPYYSSLTAKKIYGIFDQEFVKPLMKNLQDSEIYPTLVKMNGPLVRENLKELINRFDGYSSEKEYAARALCHLGCHEGFPVLEKIVRDSNWDFYSQVFAFEALAVLETDEVRSLMKDHLAPSHVDSILTHCPSGRLRGETARHFLKFIGCESVISVSQLEAYYWDAAILGKLIPTGIAETLFNEFKRT